MVNLVFRSHHLSGSAEHTWLAVTGENPSMPILCSHSYHFLSGPTEHTWLAVTGDVSAAIFCSNSVSFSYPFKACRIAVRGDVPAANPLFKFLLFFFHPFRVCRTYLACSHRWCPSCKSAAQIVFPFHPSFHPFRVCRTFPACSRRWWPINAKSCVQILTTSFN